MTRDKVTCPECGGGGVKVRKVPRYHYRESGLDGIYLEGNLVIEATCSDCGEKFVTVLMEQQLLQVIALDLLIKHEFLAGKEIRFLRETCGLTQDQLAKDLGISRRQTVLQWERGATTTRDWGSELLLRAVLLRRFKEAINQNNHLAPSHIETLLEFERVFAKYFQNFFSHKRPQRKLVQSTDDIWQSAIPILQP